MLLSTSLSATHTTVITVLYIVQEAVHSDHAAATAVSLASHSAGDDDTAVSAHRRHTGHGGGGGVSGNICSGAGVAEGCPPQLSIESSRRARHPEPANPCSKTDLQPHQATATVALLGAAGLLAQ